VNPATLTTMDDFKPELLRALLDWVRAARPFPRTRYRRR
jgi:hypothetical protein